MSGVSSCYHSHYSSYHVNSRSLTSLFFFSLEANKLLFHVPETLLDNHNHPLLIMGYTEYPSWEKVVNIQYFTIIDVTMNDVIQKIKFQSDFKAPLRNNL